MKETITQDQKESFSGVGLKVFAKLANFMCLIIYCFRKLSLLSLEIYDR